MQCTRGKTGNFGHQVNSGVHLGDNCISKIHLGRYILRYMVRNLVLLDTRAES